MSVRLCCTSKMNRNPSGLTGTTTARLPALADMGQNHDAIGCGIAKVRVVQVPRKRSS